MRGFIVLGTDTDAGKTAFSLAFLTAFADRFDYWKPVETGAPDSGRIKALVPQATVHASLMHFEEAVAPLLAARNAGQILPSLQQLRDALPKTTKPLLIETFGGPFSSYDENHLQFEVLRHLDLPRFLITSSAVGAIGRTIQTKIALDSQNSPLAAVVLVGPADPFAEEQIRKYCPELLVLNLQMPSDEWTAESLQQAVAAQKAKLAKLLELNERTNDSSDPRLIERDRQVIWHPYTSLADPQEPLAVESVDAEFIHLPDGRRLIDGISSWWTILHGHRHPPLMQALREAEAKWDHVLFAGATHEPAVQFAELLLQSLNWESGRVFYSDNGSTAVEVALKLAYQAWCHRGEPQRQLFIGFENSYHGDTFGAMSIGRDPTFFGRFEPLLFRTIQIPVSSESLDAALTTHSKEVAGVLIEPLVQGAGGMQMHSPQELKAIFEVTRRHGVYFIADEVMTGGGRTGTLWAHEQAGIRPDLICAAKTLAGGILSLAATIVDQSIVALFQTPDRTKTFFHGHSFTAHPLACSIACKNWSLLLKGNWKKQAGFIESYWRQNLVSLAKAKAVKEFRIQGTIAAVEFDTPGGYLAEVGRKLRQICLEEGVLLRPLGNVLYALPPYCTSEDSLARITHCLFRCQQSLANA
ncbi:adenosylmethionine--8-amino-7-oxononanoate transaminase [Telmatocola sphagniphila]|uniref:Adenosylmethionine-8-amino-7-oxononanoate aminotransferase n=1 Tax=Telmatocola sphagniphila TaxID=1123043 RepID=A0A8E6ETM6_9BACT|nr:adenosylmethionine--8-amino-7-oxononanoate transaminase [Telmatocola sphagniphila]QVL32614.1 adenosylmethionine--8-amino-7-oxononanoate transaminase [Telmatocola sphagniphila]